MPKVSTTAPFVQRAIDFVTAIGGLAARTRQGHADPGAWAALAQDVAIADFRYVGRARENLDWAEFLDRLDHWSRATDFTGTVERVEQSASLVFVQLGETWGAGDAVQHLTTMTIFEFDATGRLRRIDAFQ